MKRPVHCRVQSSAKCHYRFQKCLWEENKGKTYGKCSICLVSTSAEAPWAWPVVCHVFLFFPETQIRQEALSFEEVHGYGYKQAALQKVTFETLLSSWKFETREVSELIRGSLLPLKISSFMSPQMFLAPPCWTLYPLCLCSLLSAECTTFIFSILFPDNSFWFFFFLCITQEDGISLIKQLLPPSSQRSLSFVDNIHHHPLWLNPQSGSFKPPIIRVYDPSTSEQADHPSPLENGDSETQIQPVWGQTYTSVMFKTPPFN